MEIVRSTDGRHIGVNIEMPQKGQIVLLGEFQFVVQTLSRLDNNNVLLSNPNYQIELQE